MSRAKKPISAEAMHQRMVSDDSGDVLSGITLFPFFDDQGKIRSWLMVQPKKGRVWVLEGRFRKSWGGFTYRGSWRRPAPPTDEELDRLRVLYHYDPWWLLTLPAYASEPWVPALKATNVADRPDCEGLTYTEALDRTEVALDLSRPVVARAPQTGWRIRIPEGWQNPKR